MKKPHLPRRETPKWSQLSTHLDVIHQCTDVAIHKGYVKRETDTLDASLAAIIAHAHAAREMLRA